MPQERRFTQGSVIYFDHEVDDTIYIVKSGRIDISYIQSESGEKITKTLNQGEFFGLKSAIINHTREEVCEAVTDAVAIEFKVPEFENYVSKNVELMKRLLRVLSNQLRNLGIKVNNYLGNNVIYAPNIGLFKIGEYYLNNKQYKQAIQVYERYIQQYPNTNIVGEAKYRIGLCEEAQKTGFLKEFKPIDQIVDQDTRSNVTNVVMDASVSAENIHSKLGIREFMDRFYKAESFFNGQDYANAEKLFLELFQTGGGENLNQDMMEKAKFLYINTLYQLKKFKECSQEINEFLKVVKNVITIKQTLFILAEIYRSLGNAEGEKSILQKITVMPPADELSRKARDRMQAIR
jgi:TolA-binding protein